MFVKIHRSYRNVVAVCDSELVGKKFEEGKKQLDVRENFYKGEEMDAERTVEIMKKEFSNDSTFNIVGKESVNAALGAGVISDGNIGEVQGVPFALVLL